MAAADDMRWEAARVGMRKLRDRRRVEQSQKMLAQIAERMEYEMWPLRQGYAAAERGQPDDKQQSDDWRAGWRTFDRLRKMGAASSRIFTGASKK